MINRPMRGQRERVTLANELTGPCAVPRRNFTTRAGVEVVVRLAPRHVATPSSGEERRTPSSTYAPAAKTFGLAWCLVPGGLAVSERRGWVVRKSDLGGASAFLWRVSRLQYGKTGGAEPAVAAPAKPGRTQRHLATLPLYL